MCVIDETLRSLCTLSIMRDAWLYQAETRRQLRLGAVYAIGDRLRAEYEPVVSQEVPAEFRELLAKLDQQCGGGDVGLAVNTRSVAFIL
jgi:hypothetical protein